MHAISRRVPVLVIAAVAALTLTVIAAASAPTRNAAAPTLAAVPTISGPTDSPLVGDTLSASTGRWTGNPTSYTYQWDRCDAVGDRQGCAPISGATSNSHTVQKADVGHTLRVRVTATNADGSATKDSKGTGVVSAEKAAPTNKQRPSISGSAIVGSQLTIEDGTWSAATSYAHQWQQCDQNGNSCTAIDGATGKTYGVRSGDLGHELRVAVTAKNRWGSKTKNSNLTPVVKASATTTTTTTTTSGGGCAVASLRPPARMLIDRWSFDPSVVTRATRSFTARIHVSEVNSGCSVSGAQIWTTAIPYNQVGVEQTTTGGDGWATVVFTIKGGFPANPGRQQILVLLVRATRPGGSPLAGVSTVRVLAAKVRLH